MTDTDKDLLERAARAVGITLDFTIRGDFPPYYVNERGGHSSWNPLTDDGDALRLVVKLGLLVDVTHEATGAQVLNVSFVSELHNGDPYAATRRAIVRAAAALGDAK